MTFLPRFFSQPAVMRFRHFNGFGPLPRIQECNISNEFNRVTSIMGVDMLFSNIRIFPGANGGWINLHGYF